MDEPRGHDAEWNKTDRERQTPNEITQAWVPKKSNSQKKRGAVVAKGWEVGKWRGIGQGVETSSYKINKFQRSKLQYSDYN